ncbi:MAG: saccharopine dehydrogenase NADP-binding domain-containing protein [Opitutaceae bacterium]|nr:saccharopine dehydrogenase NADP-binding domain-containing protein [Cytophagales bacterium]
MQTIVVLGAGKSSYYLINYLSKRAVELNYNLIIADAVIANLKETSNIQTIQTDLGNVKNLKEMVNKAHIVVSLLPPFLHIKVAELCLELNKHFLTASYVSPEIQALAADAKRKGLIFLMECGLDPGLDHMSAMKIFDGLSKKGAIIKSFRSYCGGLIAPQSDDNPWGYKITWNPRNVVNAGKGTAQYLEGNEVRYVPYHQLFKRVTNLEFKDYGQYEAYPNRDSLSYIKIYGLKDVDTFIRGTIRKQGFCKAWDCLLQLGLTDDTVKISSEPKLTIADFVKKFLPENVSYESYLKLDDSNVKQKLSWLGLGSNENLNFTNESTPTELLQNIIEKRWKLNPGDKDLVLMQHLIEYQEDGQNRKIISSLEIEGQSQTETAMAKTVGLPLAMATLLILQNKIEAKGVIIPTIEEIYNPILKELQNHGILFREYTYS